MNRDRLIRRLSDLVRRNFVEDGESLIMEVEKRIPDVGDESGISGCLDTDGNDIIAEMLVTGEIGGHHGHGPLVELGVFAESRALLIQHLTPQAALVLAHRLVKVAWACRGRFDANVQCGVTIQAEGETRAGEGGMVERWLEDPDTVVARLVARWAAVFGDKNLETGRWSAKFIRHVDTDTTEFLILRRPSWEIVGVDVPFSVGALPPIPPGPFPPALTINEIRAQQGFPPIPDGNVLPATSPMSLVQTALSVAQGQVLPAAVNDSAIAEQMLGGEPLDPGAFGGTDYPADSTFMPDPPDED